MVLTLRQKELRQRILELSHERRCSHIGSCLSAVDIIDAIYQAKRKEDRVVLSSGHAAMALYAVLEEKKILNACAIKDLHIHPDRNVRLGISVSTGSLGQGLPIALGMALARPKNRVFCLISDGECAEGSIWESLRIICDKRICNLITVVNANGWGAYDPISRTALLRRIKGFGLNVLTVNGHQPNTLALAIRSAGRRVPSVVFAKTTVEQFSFLKGQAAHYHVMSDADHAKAMKTLGVR